MVNYYDKKNLEDHFMKNDYYDKIFYYLEHHYLFNVILIMTSSILVSNFIL